MTVTAEASHRGSAQSDRGGGPPRTPGRRPAAGSGLRTRPEATEPRLLHTEGRAHGSPAGGGSTRPAPDAELCEETGRRPHAGGPAARKGAPHGLWGRRQGPSSRTTTPPSWPRPQPADGSGGGAGPSGVRSSSDEKAEGRGRVPRRGSVGVDGGVAGGDAAEPPLGGPNAEAPRLPGPVPTTARIQKEEFKATT